MLTLLAVAALIPISYNLPTDKPLTYDVQVAFDGFIPLFGGQEGKVAVQMEVAAQGQAPTAEGTPRVTSELKNFTLFFNDAPLPIGVDAVKEYFPKTTVSMTPQGKVLTTDAPDREVPVRLPGLDVKRFPDITYLPIEFPADGIEEGKSWTFSKPFGGTNMTFNVKATKMTDSTVEMDIDIAQTLEYFEDQGKQVVATESGAFAKVNAEIKGTGKSVFNRALGLIESATIDGMATSKVTELESKAESERKLGMKLETKLRK